VLPPRFKIPVLFLLVFVLHAGVMASLRTAGLPNDIVLLLPITAAIVAGSERGAIVGFVAGMLADLFLETPMGLSALTFSVVGFALGVLQGNVIRASWWIAPLTALVGSAAGMVLFALIGATVGQSHLVGPDLPWIAVSTALVNAPISVLLVRAMAWALATDTSSERSFAPR
jgi:rod shape-determining protein MreD